MTQSSKPKTEHTLDGTIQASTDKAVLFRATKLNGNPWPEDINNLHWFPRTQLSEVVRGEIGEDDTIIASDWILRAKEIIE